MPNTGWKNTSPQMGVNILCGTFSNLGHGAILVFQNNETAAIVGVPKINPARVKRVFYVKAFFRGFQ